MEQGFSSTLNNGRSMSKFCASGANIEEER
jgi:hypothetical protein